MPEESAGERTEEATDHKRRSERERGNVARSRDLTASLVLLGGILLLRYGGHTIFVWLFTAARVLIGEEMGTLPIPDGQEVLPHAYRWLTLIVYGAVPFAVAVFFVAYAANVAQVGFLFTTETLNPDLNRLNPVRGFQRIFGMRSLVQLAMNLLKLAVVVSVAYATLAAALPEAGILAQLEPAPMFAFAGEAVYTLAIRLAAVLFVLGAADMAYQWYQRNQDMRMTKQEVKEELKQYEGDPHIKNRRRQIQRQMAMQRMMQEVPEAEVVIRNPTHFAVALSFKPEMEMPVLVAKGTDKMALRIIDIAREAGVPVWQDPPLARSLYRELEIGDPIPAQFFQVVAEILAKVMDADKRAAYQRRMGSAA